MGYTVRAIAGLDFYGKRSTAVLSDGSAVLVVPENNAGTRRLYVYHSTNRTAWTLKNTLTPANALAAGKHYSMVADDANNLHFTWEDSAGHIRYLKLTFSAGPTWAAGSEELVGSGTGKDFRYVDLDHITGNVVFVATVNYTDKTLRSWVRRSSDNTWVQLTDKSLSAGVMPTYGELTVARDAGGPSGTTATVAYVARTTDTVGDIIQIKKFNTSTGAQISDDPVGGRFWANASAYRNYFLFSRAANDWMLMALVGGSTARPYAMRFSSTAYITGWKGGPSVPRNFILGSATAGWAGEGGTFIWKYGSLWYNATVTIDGTGLRWSGRHAWMADDTNANITQILSGNNRNFTQKKIDTFDYRGAGANSRSWFNQPPPTPTLIGPGEGTTVTTDFPTLTSRVLHTTPNPQMLHRGKWILARDAAFTINVLTKEDPRSQFVLANLTPKNIAETSPELFQGTWYARAILVDQFGVESTTFNANTDNSFTVSHPPVGTPQAPSGGKYYSDFGAGYLTFSWRFTDSSPLDYLTAYQILVELNDGSGTVIADSGKIVLSAPYTQNGDLHQANLAISSAYKDVALKWYVKLWDSDDVPGVFSPEAEFYFGDIPTIVITDPAADGATVTTPSPTITWTFSAPGGRTQSDYRVQVIKDTVTQYDSGWVSGNATSFIIPDTAGLQNLASYTIALSTRDSGGLENTVYRTITVSYTPPAAPAFTLDPNGYNTNGYLQITWTNAARDTDFNSWRIYRRKTGTSNWVLVEEVTDDIASYVYQDWLLPSNEQYDYAVVQTAIRFGTVVESAYNATAVTTTSEDYWLIHPTDSSLNVRLNIVTADSYSEEYETNVLNLIGRGRKTDIGTRWGYTGTLNAQLRDSTAFGTTARQQKLALENLREQRASVYLRNPFGDIWYVMMGDVGVSRIAGVGAREFVDLTIPYQEVVD